MIWPCTFQRVVFVKYEKIKNTFFNSQERDNIKTKLFLFPIVHVHDEGYFINESSGLSYILLSFYYNHWADIIASVLVSLIYCIVDK